MRPHRTRIRRAGRVGVQRLARERRVGLGLAQALEQLAHGGQSALEAVVAVVAPQVVGQATRLQPAGQISVVVRLLEHFSRSRSALLKNKITAVSAKNGELIVEAKSETLSDKRLTDSSACVRW